MLKLATLCFLFFSAQFVLAQKPPIKFGEIPMDQLKMTTYEKDSSAEAVVLSDYGESLIAYDQSHDWFVLNFERIRRVKILTKEGLKWANFSIALYRNDTGEDEKVSGLKAVTYNLENGKVVETKVKSDAIFKEKYDKNFDVIKVTWPEVKVGSIIEVTYTINSDFLFNFQDWEFQETIPTIWSEYRAQIPEYFNYEKYLQGYIILEINEKKDYPGSIVVTTRDLSGWGQSKVSTDKIDFTKTNFRWAAKDVPAFKSEPSMTTYLDFISKMNFELSFIKRPNQPIKNYMGSWEDITRQFAEDPLYGEQITANNFLNEIAEDVTKGITTPEEKIQAIFDFVKKNMLWNGVSQEDINSSLKKTWEDKKGNATEINLLLASILEKVGGFKVYPILLSTRDHGFVREATPVSTQFNYTICEVKVGEKSILLDATEKLLPLGMLPERCLNGKGLAISKEGGYRWIDLTAPIKSKMIVNADLVLEDSGALKGKLQIERTGYFGLDNRKEYILKGEKDYIRDFVAGRPWEITKSQFQNDRNIQQPFTESHDVIITEHVTIAGDIVYINPFVLFRQESNPYKSETRQYPVDFGSPFDETQMIKFAFPSQYVVEEIPQSKVFVLPGGAGKYFYNVTSAGNAIIITSGMYINHSVYTQEEYPNLREFYNHIVAKQSEQIVLKKK